MNEKDDPRFRDAGDEPPVTLESVSTDLLWTMDQATWARDTVEALRMAFINYLASLHHKGVFDVSQFILELILTLPGLEERKNIQMALQFLIEELQYAVAWRDHAPPGQQAN